MKHSLLHCCLYSHLAILLSWLLFVPVRTYADSSHSITPIITLHGVTAGEEVGSITFQPESEQVVVATAVAQSGYTFAGWEYSIPVNCTTKGITATITLAGDNATTLTANFVRGSWERVTDIAQLQHGDKLLIAGTENAKENVAGGLSATGNTLLALKVAFDEDDSHITYIDEDYEEFTLEGSKSAWVLRSDLGRLSTTPVASETKLNYLNSENDKYALWNITINKSTNYTAYITNNSKTIYHYNNGVGSQGFLVNTSRPNEAQYFYPTLYRNTTTPRILIETQALQGFSYAYGKGPSSAQKLSIMGENITTDITITPDETFEISTEEDGTYTSNPLSTAATSDIYVRMKANLAVGTYTGTLTISHDEATSRTVTLAGEVVANLTTLISNTETTWSVQQEAELKIRLQGVTIGDTIRIIDSTGRTITQFAADAIETTITVPAWGVYFVQSTNSNGSTQTKKIIIL